MLPVSHFTVSSPHVHGFLTTSAGLRCKNSPVRPEAARFMKEMNMYTGIFSQFTPAGGNRWRLVLVPAVLAVSGAVLATPPLGFVVNQIVTMGSNSGGIGQQVQIARNPDADDEPWQAQLQSQGATDFYIRPVVLAPGGYSGLRTL